MLQWIITKYNRYLKTTAMVLIFCAVVFGFGGIFAAMPVSAQSVASPDSELNVGLQIIQEPLGLAATDIRIIIARIIRIALGLVGIIMVVMFIYAGFLWMTAGGNDEQIGRAKKILINAAIGLAIILSAYSIVWFVMRMLGLEGGGGSAQSPLALEQNIQNPRGSGALGKMIKDHYPMRDEAGIPRNAKIILTFSRPISAQSLIEDTNGDRVFGNCNNIEPFNWSANCDRLILDDTHININKVIMQNGQQVLEPISGAAALASYSTDAQGARRLYTVVIKPYVNLGSDAEEVVYEVRVGNNIILDDELNHNPKIFDVKILDEINYDAGEKYYFWRFVCSKELDETPPRVTGVYPANTAIVSRNTAIQIDFSEAMDPTGIQGAFQTVAGQTFFAVSGDNVYLKSENSTLPGGRFNLVNGYKTLEFLSDKECGVNACGGKIFCLPVCDKPGADCAQDEYRLLLRAGLPPAGDKWEALPFTGLMDISGNALDGNNNRVINRAPRDAGTPIFGIVGQASQEQPDNYYWNFTVDKDIDKTAPFLKKIIPGLDAQNVAPDQTWRMEFSKRMLVDSIYSIGIDESLTPAARCEGVSNCSPTPLWITPRVSAWGATVDMLHGPFLNTFRQYYFPVLTSALVDVNYNCFYPAKGPRGAVPAGQMESTVCDNAHPENCCDVSEAGVDNPGQAFCCNGVSGGDNKADTCKASLIDITQ